MVPRWTQSLSFVARRELEHLAFVDTLLIAIGARPHLRHPGVPFSEPDFNAK